MNNWYYVYLLRSKKNNSIYIGCTRDINKRLKRHNEGRNYATKHMLPVELIYAEAYKSKKDAYKREKHLKYYGSGLRNLKLRLEDTFIQPLCEGLDNAPRPGTQGSSGRSSWRK